MSELREEGAIDLKMGEDVPTDSRRSKNYLLVMLVFIGSQKISIPPTEGLSVCTPTPWKCQFSSILFFKNFDVSDVDL